MSTPNTANEDLKGSIARLEEKIESAKRLGNFPLAATLTGELESRKEQLKQSLAAAA